MPTRICTQLWTHRGGETMSAVYPSDEPEDEEKPGDLIDRIIDRIIGDEE